MKLPKCTFSLLLLIIACTSIVHAQTDEGAAPVEDPAAVAVKQLASRDAQVRQHAAEELARLEATDQRRLIEGYRLQEKNARVKLALDWTLYRMGKNESLFAVVRALDSSRFDQAHGYLVTLENPEPLYFFLGHMNGNMQVKLLEILAKIGNAETLDHLKSYSESLDPKVGAAAGQAAREIEQRLGQTPADKSTRPRQVGTGVGSP
jgi:HEAT repeat protein